MMKEILLSQGRIALVDDKDFKKLNQWKWCATKAGKAFYAKRSFAVNGKQRTIYMHHEIIGRPPKGFETDHRNGQGLDNREKNLRHVTCRQNLQNKRNIKKTSQYPGVYWCKRGGRWMAYICINGDQKYLGSFVDKFQAFKTYKQAVENLGETIVGGR